MPYIGTLPTSAPHKPVKSSCKKPTNSQPNKYIPFRWLSCLSVAQHPQSGLFPGGQETWIKCHPQTGLPEPFLFHSRASTGTFVICKKQGERRRVQPRKAHRCRQGFGHGSRAMMAPRLHQLLAEESAGQGQQICVGLSAQCFKIKK